MTDHAAGEIADTLALADWRRVIGTLYAMSTAFDTDWIVRISDVAPDGLSRIVADGIRAPHSISKSPSQVSGISHLSSNCQADSRGFRVKLFRRTGVWTGKTLSLHTGPVSRFP